MDYSYIAGLFDGEGHITISKQTRNRPSPKYFLVSGITNSDLSVLEEIQKLAGGTIYYDAGKGRHTPVYRLTFYALKAIPFLKAMRPFLRIKAEQADIAIAFQERQSLRTSRQTLSNEEIEFYEKCRNEILVRHGTRCQVKGFMKKEEVIQID